VALPFLMAFIMFTLNNVIHKPLIIIGVTVERNIMLAPPSFHVVVYAPVYNGDTVLIKKYRLSPGNTFASLLNVTLRVYNDIHRH
jgi:hypothetical protein